MSRTGLLLGIDEAGRGPVIGPLVVCGVWVRSRKERTLVDLGVRDSKSFGSSDAAREHRLALAARLLDVVSNVSLLVVDAAEVDRWASRGKLNLLEQELARTIIEAGPAAAKIIADGERLFEPLSRRYTQLEARNKADVTSPVVAAASILAKVERDKRFAEIVAPFQGTLGPIGGGGYVNQGTEAFVRDYFQRFGRPPPELRRSWGWRLLDELGVQRPVIGEERGQLALPSLGEPPNDAG